MPHKEESAVKESKEAISHPPAAVDRGILNTVAASTDDDADLTKNAEQFYSQLSEKQKGVVQAKQRAEEYLAEITHADTKAEQVERMDKKVMNGSVFRQAARLQVSEAGYDGAEEEGDEDEDEEEERGEKEKEADDKGDAERDEDEDGDETQQSTEGKQADDESVSGEADETEQTTEEPSETDDPAVKPSKEGKSS